MMIKYYVRTRPQFDGNNAVHVENCPFLDGIQRKRYLGEFLTVQDAIKEAQRFYDHIKGCPFCNKELVKLSRKKKTFWHSYSLS